MELFQFSLLKIYAQTNQNKLECLTECIKSKIGFDTSKKVPLMTFVYISPKMDCLFVRFLEPTLVKRC